MNGRGPASTPLARRLAREAGIALAGLAGSGPGGRIVAADIAAPRRAPLPSLLPADRRPSTPFARRLARAAGLDWARLAGSGPNGRVTAADVRRAGDDTVTVECNTAALEALRDRLNAALAKGASAVTASDLLVKAVAWALARGRGGPVDLALVDAGGTVRALFRAADRTGVAAIAAQRGTPPGRHDGAATLAARIGAAGGLTLTIRTGGGPGVTDKATIARRVKDAIEWPTALLL